MSRAVAAAALATLAAGALVVTAARQRAGRAPSHRHAATLAAGRADADSFLALARRGTERYADPAVAGREGFRRVGVEFPAMGEHWVNLARVMADTLDAASPSVLTYARIRGRLTLVGVGYTDIMSPGEQPPAFQREHWHEHNGSIAEESLARPASGGARDDALRVAILHAWTPLANPAGAFVTDNVALPFARHGLAPAEGADPRLVAALALAAGTADYYELASRGDDARAPGDTVARALLARHAAGAAAAVGGAGDTLDVARREALLGRWDALWREVGRAHPARARTAARLRTAGDVHVHH